MSCPGGVIYPPLSPLLFMGEVVTFGLPRKFGSATSPEDLTSS